MESIEAGVADVDNPYSRLPGSLVGAYLEQRVGKREAMATSTIGTALSVLAFVLVSSTFAVKIATMCISFMGECCRFNTHDSTRLKVSFLLL